MPRPGNCRTRPLIERALAVLKGAQNGRVIILGKGAALRPGR